jgi:hypothetical protein
MQPPSSLVLLAQAGSLLFTAVSATWSAFWYMPIALLSAVLRTLLPGCDGRCDGSAVFYEGTVMHSRKQPKEHKFR